MSDKTRKKLTSEYFREIIDKECQESIAVLQKIWIEAGYQEDECLRLLQGFLGKLKATCVAEIAEEKTVLEDAKEQVNLKINQYTELCAQLGRFVDEKSLLKGRNNYADKLAELERIISEISYEVSQRQKILDVEYNAIKKLQTDLGDTDDISKVFPPNEIPLSDNRLHTLRAIKSSLEKKKTERIEEIKTIAREYYAFIKKLYLIEEANLQTKHFNYVHAVQQLIEVGTWEIGIHINDLVNLKSEFNSMVDEDNSRTEELSKMGDEIARLWTLLRVPSAEREAFRASFKTGPSLDTLNKGRSELTRLMQVRTLSLAKVVAVIRSDIAELWTELGVIDDEDRRNSFPPYFEPLDSLQDSSVG
jgi:hypothetical protein